MIEGGPVPGERPAGGWMAQIRRKLTQGFEHKGTTQDVRMRQARILAGKIAIEQQIDIQWKGYIPAGNPATPSLDIAKTVAQRCWRQIRLKGDYHVIKGWAAKPAVRTFIDRGKPQWTDTGAQGIECQPQMTFPILIAA